MSPMSCGHKIMVTQQCQQSWKHTRHNLTLVLKKGLLGAFWLQGDSSVIRPFTAHHRQQDHLVKYKHINRPYTNGAYVILFQISLTSTHFPQLYPPVHPACSQKSGAWAESHGVDLSIMSILKRKKSKMEVINHL